VVKIFISIKTSNLSPMYNLSSQLSHLSTVVSIFSISINASSQHSHPPVLSTPEFEMKERKDVTNWIQNPAP